MRKNIKHFLLLSAFTTGCIYGVNKFVDTTSGIKNTITKSDGHYFNWRYGNIFYTKQGKGSPILLIHDLHPSSSSNEWKFIARLLKQNHTVYTIDLLGCGRSDKPNLTYTNYMYVQLLTDFIKKIIGLKTDVIATGHSCTFTLMAATMDYSILRSLFFISPPSLHSLQACPTKQDQLIKRILYTPIIGTFFYNIQMSEANISETFEQEYYRKKNLISCKLKDIYYESAHACHSKGRYLLGSITANYTNTNIIPALKKVENTIFLIGSCDTQEYPDIMDSYREYDETIETAVMSNINKLPQLEDPNKLYEIICMLLE
ncbi:alpha/beta fold hydrolase [Lachnospiraceae bacterium]|nr:alpha/beta fold hydrolase [Lachnospiraceae bacterium]